MKTTQLLLVFLILPLFMFSQVQQNKKYKVTTGIPYPEVKANETIFSNNDGIIEIVKLHKKNIVLQEINTETSEEISNHLIPVLNKGENFRKILKLKGKIYIFITAKDKPNDDHYTLYSKEINFSNKSVGERKKLVAFKSNYYNDYLLIRKSADESKVFILNNEKPIDKNKLTNQVVLFLVVLNSELKTKWTKEVQMRYKEQRMQNIKYDIDNKGIVYILTEVYDDDTKKKYLNNEFNYHIELITVFKDEVNYSKLDNRNFHITSLNLYEPKNKDMYLFGYYADNVLAKGNANEMFIAKLNDLLEIEVISSFEIPLNIISQYESESTQEKNIKKEQKGILGIPNLKIIEIIPLEDSCYLIIGEQRTVSYNGNMLMFSYKDVILTKIDANGKLQWMSKVPKNNGGPTEEGPNSYKYINYKGDHYIVFLGIVDKSNTNIPIKQDSGEKGIKLIIYSINDDGGDIDISSVLNLKQVEIQGQMMPIAIYKYSQKKIVETQNGFSIEMNKKKKQDVMVNISID